MWQQELVYGDHNLAVLALERGQLKLASESFERARRMLSSMLARNPLNAQMVFDLADEVSWQGNVEEQSGRLAQAEAMFASKADTVGELAAAHPTDLRWKLEWSRAQLMQSELLRVLGNHRQAEMLASAAVARMRLLILQDPSNRDGSDTYLKALVARAAARIGTGNLVAARRDLTLAQPLKDRRAKQVIGDQNIRRDIIDAQSLRVMLALHDGDDVLADKTAMALQALYLGKQAPTSMADIGRMGMGEILAGMAAAVAGRPAAADARYASARRMLAEPASHSRYWRILDPWARLLLLTGDAAEATRVKALLSSYGYAPLFPWPASAGGA